VNPFLVRKFAEEMADRIVLATDSADAPVVFADEHCAMSQGDLVYVVVTTAGGVFPRSSYWRVQCVASKEEGKAIYAAERTNFAAITHEMRKYGVKI
jgi:hypothetical protein